MKNGGRVFELFLGTEEVLGFYKTFSPKASLITKSLYSVHTFEKAVCFSLTSSTLVLTKVNPKLWTSIKGLFRL